MLDYEGKMCFSEIHGWGITFKFWTLQIEPQEPKSHQAMMVVNKLGMVIYEKTSSEMWQLQFLQW